MNKTYMAFILCFLLVASAASGESVTDQLIRNLSGLNDINHEESLRNFAINSDADCKTWHPKAFERNRDLAEACTIFQLSQTHFKRLETLQNFEKSGIILSEIIDSSPKMWIPALSAGAWEIAPFVDADGAMTATEVLASRIGIEKAFLFHARYIRSQNKELFSTFASFNIPQLISSFSGYSLAARLLAYTNAFDCGLPEIVKTQACQDSREIIKAVQREVLMSLGTEDFLSRLDKLNSKNSSRSSMKFHQVLKTVAAIEKLRNEALPTQILQSINGSNIHPAYLSLQNAIAEISESPLSKKDIHQMLLAVSILSEIQYLQKKASLQATSLDVNSPLRVAPIIAEQIYELKSWVTKALVQEEQVQ